MQRRIDNTSRKTATIDQVFDDFASIWSRNRSLAERSVFDLWLHVVDHAARVASAIRREHPKEVIDDLADTTAWLMSFVAQCKFSKNVLDAPFIFEQPLSHVIWQRYPGLCPHCLDRAIMEHVGRPQSSADGEISPDWLGTARQWLTKLSLKPTPASTCDCPVPNEFSPYPPQVSLELRSLRVFYAEKLAETGRAILTVAGLETMFGNVFEKELRSTALDKIAFRLMEEVGDVTRAIKDCYTFDRRREPFSVSGQSARRERLRDELADLFGQVFALGLRIRQIYYQEALEYMHEIEKGILGQPSSPAVNAFSFMDVLWSKYGTSRSGGLLDSLRCPGCETTPCTCQRELLIVWGRVHDSAAFGTDGHDKKGTPSGDERVIVTPIINFSPIISVSSSATSIATSVVTSWRGNEELRRIADEIHKSGADLAANLDNLEAAILTFSDLEGVKRACEEAIQAAGPEKQSRLKHALARFIEPFSIAIMANLATSTVQDALKSFAAGLKDIVQQLLS